MHYELFMGAALGEARAALDCGERPRGAAAVLGEALVASGHEEVAGRGDPTAHAVMVTLREAAQRLGTRSLAGVTVFTIVEPCSMCVGAMLEADVDCLVYALPDPVSGAAGSVVQLANNPALSRRVDLISGILRADAAELQEAAAPRDG
jgi:tRNA(adenine34) deaminase